MPRGFIRAAIAAVLVGLLFAIGSLPSYAEEQSLPNHIHVFHVKSWYDQQENSSLLGRLRNLKYHGGPVMQATSTTYAIYWVPPGFTVSSSYQSLINRYFNDIGGSSFYNIVTQYYQNNYEYIVNSSSLGGAWLDTSAYPHAGTAADPLTDADIQAEVARAASVNGWTPSSTTMFFVFTAKGVESCASSTACTPGTSNPVYCAYHGYFENAGQPFIYANMPYAATWGSSCRVQAQSPNSDSDADTEISVTSHEHFEAVTDLDPQTGTLAWVDRRGYEIGDKCANSFGTIQSDGHNITLNGNPYIVQLEWSNATSSCASSF